jgi:hypothetical protein
MEGLVAIRITTEENDLLSAEQGLTIWNNSFTILWK